MADQAASADTPRPFDVPIFRSIWIAGLLANFGSLIQAVGAGWMMTSLTPSPVMVTLVQSSTVLPIMLLALIAGAIADNVSRRNVMVAAQIAMFVVSAVLTAFAFAGQLTPALLLAFTFLIGCGIAINTPSASASTGDMVPRAVLPAAVALATMGYNIARSVGPAIGGVLVATAGANFAFLVNALSYLGLIAVLLMWKPDYPPRALPREALMPAVAQGLRYISMSPHLRVVMLRAGCFGIFASGVSALMPLIAKDLTGGGATAFGALSAGFGAGAVIGALIVARLRNQPPERVVQIASLVLALGTAGAGLSRYAPLTFVAMVVAGIGWVVGLSIFNILVQLTAPRWVVGRALSCYQMCAFGAMAIGGWLIGEATAEFGVAATLLMLAGIQAANALLGFVLPLEDVGAKDLDPVFTSFEPDTAVPISPRSGPVVISFTYQIAPEDARTFLDLMAEVRRIRRRDGASGWTIMRDLGDPERWVERFHLPTWTDYLRHLERRTRDDLGALERAFALHRGPERPHVTRLLERQTARPNPRAESEPRAEQPHIV